MAIWKRPENQRDQILKAADDYQMENRPKYARQVQRQKWKELEPSEDPKKWVPYTTSTDPRIAQARLLHLDTVPQQAKHMKPPQVLQLVRKRSNSF